jgi:hypothetical protein
MALIGIESNLPNCWPMLFDKIDQQKQVLIHSMAAGKRSMLFGVPGPSTQSAVA